MFALKSRFPLLVTAHPGHELLLHHWLELQDRAVVVALTDGSGSAGKARAERSRCIINSAGAIPGPVFGQHPDRYWYDAILRVDPDPFLAVVETVANTMSRETSAIVVDPVEHFNPMHDLAAVVGHLISKKIRQNGAAINVATYAIEKPGCGVIVAELTLDGQAQRRKLAAVDNYYELAEEAKRVKAASTHIEFARELLYALDLKQAFPERLAETPYYEQVGRARFQSHTYSQVITYADHVRPLALKLLGAGDEDFVL